MNVTSFGPFDPVICPSCNAETHVKKDFGTYRLEQAGHPQVFEACRTAMTRLGIEAPQEVSIHRVGTPATSASMASLLVTRLASPSQMMMRAELIALVEDALEKMDPIDREILALRHFEELRNGEVAEVLGLKEAAASNRYVRALGRLRDVLEQLPEFLDSPDSNPKQ